MIRFAVPPIGGAGWYGGWNYMSNLVRTLSAFGDPQIATCLFIGRDRIKDPLVAELGTLERVELVCHPAFEEHRVRTGQFNTLLSGENTQLTSVYRKHAVDVAFAPATYLGWRSALPSIAWFPDFQHRHLPELFRRSAWWKREIGFRAQVHSSSAIVLSSADAERDCLRFYPKAKGRTVVARFAVPTDGWPSPDEAIARIEAEGLGHDFVFLPNQLWQHKNHALAIAAASKLGQRGSSKRILATGHGTDPRRPDYRSALQAMVEQHGAAANFRFLGSVDHFLVKCLTMVANALLNPSRFEGWSTSVEEAKAIGAPMILSDLAVHREQAPGATFVGLDDADALADAIERTRARSREQLAGDLAAARQPLLERQQAFALTLSKAIYSAHRGERRPA